MEASPTATSGPAEGVAAGGPVGAAGGALPNLIVIGAQKCGTSGLHYHLGLHPEISMSKPKELNFFIEERTWPRGVDWYRSHFAPEAVVRGEASPNYTAYPQHLGVPERIHSVVPDVHLIYMLRDPLDRIAAHWVHNYAKRREKGDLRSTLSHSNTSYLVRSQYHMQLQQFLRHFPIEQIMVVDQADLRERRSDLLREIFAFVGADPGFSHPGFERERHATARKTRASRWAVKMERLSKTRAGRRVPPNVWFAADHLLPLRKPIERPDVREALSPEALRVLREDAERLRELTGREFSEWSIFRT